MRYGGLTFDGGTLQVTGTTMTSTARAITWGAGGGGFDIAEASNTFTVSQALLGGGSLTKLGAGTLVLSGTNTYTGGTELAAGILSVAADNNLGAAAGDLRFTGGTLKLTDTLSSARTATLTSAGGTIIVDDTKTATFSGVFANALEAKGGLTKSGDGTLIMTAQNTYTGDTTISGGVLQLGDGVTDGFIAGDIVNNASLVVNNIDATALSQVISGTGSLTQMGTGTLTLSGDNSYSGDTNLNAGTISASQDDNLGGVAGALNFNGGTLQVTGTIFDTTTRTINWGANGGGFDIADADNTFSLATIFTGAGALNKLGTGTLALSGDSSAFTGQTNVNAGQLRLDDGALGGAVNVNNTGALGGNGTIGGTAAVADGGTLFGQSNQVLAFKSGLTLATGSQTDVTLNSGPSNDALFDVTGDLALNGQLNVQTGSVTPIGVYRIFDYSGALTANTMTIGTVAEGNVSDYSLQTAVNHQVNLVNTGGREFFYWDGTGPKNDGVIDGGNGTWSLADDNWTDKDGQNNSAWLVDSFAVFEGAAGTVTIDAGYTPSVNGMQFMTDGYRIEGGTITLAGQGDQLIIVGDGSLESASMTATIASVIQGTEGLTKSGTGTLALTGANTYTGDTKVTEGTLELGDGGSLVATSNIILASTRYGVGTLAINKTGAFTLSNQISGEGAVVQRGAGTTTFAGDNSFSGGLSVEKGVAQAGIADTAFGTGMVAIGSGAKLDLANFNETIGGLAGGMTGDGDITLGSGTLTLNQMQHDDFSGVISGTGGLTLSQASTSSLTLYGANTYSGDTNVAGAKLIQGAQGAFSGTSAYSVADGSAIDLGGFSTNMAALSNSGAVNFGGTGGTVLNIAGNYTGNGGTLAINTVLADDNAVSDKLQVSGNTSGTTKVQVTNRGGLGAQTVNGIKVVDVNGQSNGTFTLNGDYTTKDGQQALMTSSAYAYTLQKNSKADPNDGNWYLVSQNTKPNLTNPTDPTNPTNPTNPTDPTDPTTPTGPRYSAAAPIYEAYTATLQALNRLSTLQQRVGDRYLGQQATQSATQAATQADAASNAAIWGRVEGAHNRLESGSTYR
ncbi:autotransporter-associated beta strand repeat-containing protein [Brucella rhizosphaerae]|uniref:autotransporter-associated beta strand repeat-containing protein n=1 Tax=Brucella rhizosphaerae TaxID=571254 RepID=UPI00361F7915